MYTDCGHDTHNAGKYFGREERAVSNFPTDNRLKLILDSEQGLLAGTFTLALQSARRRLVEY
jgi:hypothetical protein